MRSYSPYYDPNAGVSLGVSGGGGAVGADQAHGPPASGGPAAGEPEVPGTLPDPGVRFSPQQIGSHNRQLNVFYLRPDDDEAHERFMADIGAMVAGGVPGAWPGPALPDVPVPSPQHVPRPDLLDAARNLLAPGTGRGPGMVGLVGMGGVGKTTAARAICDDAAVRARFADGIIWLTVGVGADPVTCQRDLAAVLGDLSPIDDATAGRDKLRGLLSGKSCLIVADDIWAAEVAVALDVGLPDVRLLVTTRDQQALTRDAGTCQLDLADDGTARRILAAWARTTPTTRSA